MTNLILSIALWCGQIGRDGSTYKTSKEIDECRIAIFLCLDKVELRFARDADVYRCICYQKLSK